MGVFYAKEGCEALFQLGHCGILAETDHLGRFSVENSHKNAHLRGLGGELCSWLTIKSPRSVSAVMLQV